MLPLNFKEHINKENWEAFKAALETGLKQYVEKLREKAAKQEVTHNNSDK